MNPDSNAPIRTLQTTRPAKLCVTPWQMVTIPDRYRH